MFDHGDKETFVSPLTTIGIFSRIGFHGGPLRGVGLHLSTNSNGRSKHEHTL